jgi:membrane fusion protein, multidrug efflux system
MKTYVRWALLLLMLIVGVGVGWYGPKYINLTDLGVSTSTLSPATQSPQSTPKPASKPAPRAIPVEVAQAERIPFAKGLTAVGSLKSEESVTLRAEQSGRIAEINFKEGQPVVKGQLLFRLDDAVSRAELEQARASLAIAQGRQNRAKQLFAEGFVSKEARDDASNSLKVQQASVDLAQAKLEKMRIQAPFDGVIGLRSVSLGEYVSPGLDLAPLESIQKLKVDFRLPELYVAQVKVGQKLELRVDALPNQVFPGDVFAISPLIEAGGRSVLVRASVDNEAMQLRPGMFARVQLLTQDSLAIVVPESAISPSNQKQYVYRVVNNRIEEVEVIIGERHSGLVQIRSGLEPNDIVVIAGLQRVRDKALVKILGDQPLASVIAKDLAKKAQGELNALPSLEQTQTSPNSSLKPGSSAN